MGDSSIPYLKRDGKKGKGWNPICGCTPVSAGCANCWAKRLHEQRYVSNTQRAQILYQGDSLPFPHQYDLPFTKVQLFPDRLSEPLRSRTPRTVAVCFGGDLFHEDVPDEFLADVFAVMADCQHTFLVLTKRPQRMLEFTRDLHFPDNVWLGVSVEDQATADERIPLLLKTLAAHRWVSYEPALDAVDFRPWLKLVCGFCWPEPCQDVPGSGHNWPRQLLDWLVIGGESGPNFRPMDLAWAESAVAQCDAAGVPVYFKQIAAKRSGQPSGTALDSRKETPW